jgi:serine/threonine protein kinase
MKFHNRILRTVPLSLYTEPLPQEKMVIISDEIQIKNAPTKVLLQTAEEIVQGISQRSTFFNDEKLQSLPTFFNGEIQVGRIIGRGGFCTVKELVGIKTGKSKKGTVQRRMSNGNLNDQSSVSNNAMSLTYNGVDMSAKEYLTHSCNRGKGVIYVVKQVAEELEYSNRITFLKGCVDLALEAKYLSTLSHPNIIEVKGVSAGGPFRQGYFIVLDRLHDTLPSKLKKWTTVDRQCKGITGVFTGGKKKIDGLFVNRMQAAYGIANAVNYIHSRNLVYRDLVSPSNH